MFEVIYISSSCKQAAEFIDRLMWKLRECGIYDFQIDQRNLQLKSDKFIVSAVDIFCANLGRDHRFTKYYIDKVSGADYQNERIREKSFERLKRLKCSFREGIKEISEKELIEILTEVSTHD